MEGDAVWTSKEVWPLIVATGVFSSFATFIFAGFADAFKARWNRKKAAHYAAIRCAVSLERYATDCWDIFFMSKGEFDYHRDITPQPLPAAPAFPDDVDWTSIDQALADDILSFANGSSIAESLVNYAKLWESNPFEFQEAARDRGLRALKLAARARKRYQMASPDDLDRLWKDFTPPS
jgi:hypothetical protein